MNISDYEKTAPAIDTHPRPRASQDTAAKKRIGDGGVHPLSAPRDYTFVAAVVGILTITGVLAVALSQFAVSRPMAQPTVTTVPTLAPTQAATLVPTAVPVVMIPAYAAPNGLVLGPIEATRPIAPVAHYGAGWVAYQDGAGLVWVRVSDRPDLALVGPDLAAQAPAPQTGRGLTLAVATPEPEEAPAPTPVPAQPTSADVLKIRTESDCNAEHGRCDPPCTAEHGRCAVGDK